MSQAPPLLIEDQNSIENAVPTPTINDKSIEDLEMMLQMQEKMNNDNQINSREQYLQNPTTNSLDSMETGSPKKNIKKNQGQKTRVVPQSQQKMSKNNGQNMQSHGGNDHQMQYMGGMQAKTMQPKRTSSMNPMKSAQNIRTGQGVPVQQFYQTVGSNVKNNNINQFGQVVNHHHVPISNSQSSSPQFDEKIGAPMGGVENHQMQVTKLQEHKNKKMVTNSNSGIPSGQTRGQDGNTANIVSQIMMNQQIQQNIKIQQSNSMKQHMKGKLNIKVVKNSSDGQKPDQNRQQAMYGIAPSGGVIQSTKVTNPSVVGSSDMHNAGMDSGRQKSPSYIQTLTSYNSNSAKPHKTSTKKNIKILSNSASLKKTLHSNASNPSITNTFSMPGSQSDVQNAKKNPNVTKKNSQLKSETRYQAVLAMDALNQQEKTRGSQLQATSGDVGDDQIPNMFSSDYYRTSQNQKFATQNINLKQFNSVSPTRNKGNKTSNSVSKQNPQLLNHGKSSSNLDYNLGLKNSIKNLQKNGENKGYNTHLINSASRAVRESSKDSIRKKPYATVSNKGKSMNKFGQGKNSVKPPTKKQVMVAANNNQAAQKQYNNTGNGSNNGSRNNSPQRMKVSRSSMGVGHQMQNMQQSVMSHSSGSQISNTSASAMQVKDSIGPQQVSAQRDNQMGNIYTQLSDRVRRKTGGGPNVGQYQVHSTSGNMIKPLQRNSSMSQYSKKHQQQLHYLPIQAKRGSLPHQAQEALTRSLAGNSSASGSRAGGNQPFSNASGRTSENKYASQERAMKMAEDNLNKIDEILAQNQKHLQQKKKASSTLQNDELQGMTATQGQIKIHITDKNSLMKSGSTLNDRKSPLGYLTQVNQNTMSNLNINNVINQQEVTPQKGRVKAKKGSVDKNNQARGVMMQINNEKLSFTDEMQQFAVLQKINTQSPIDIPSSSNTSKHSNKTFSQSLVSNTNQYAPEVKRIGQQFNDIVKSLQMIEQLKLDHNDVYEQQTEENVPPISDVISKLYSVKSSYDTLIKNMSKQITQLQTQIQKPSYQNMPTTMLQPERLQATSQRVGTMSTSNINVSGSQYNKVSYRKEMTPHGPHRDPPLSASSQSRTRMDAFVGGTGGSMNKCKYCKGMGQAPSSNSASERHTYAVASDRAVHTVENVPINSIENISNQHSQNRLISVQRFGNAADHITINLPVPQEQSIESRESQRTKYEEMLEKKFNSEKKGRTHSQSVKANTNDSQNEQRSNVNALLQQIRVLKEENKKMDALQEQNKKFIKDLQEKDKQIVKAERQAALQQSSVQKKAQEQFDKQSRKIRELETQLAQVKKQKNELSLKNAQKMNERSSSKNKKTQHAQTDIYLENFISEKELDLLVELKQQERKLKKIQKEKTYNANKISKFIYFFFTLQNKGIPVNEIYENDGVKFIQTDRFEEIMGQTGNKDEMGASNQNQDKKPSGSEEQTDQLSFYSDDSYEYVQLNIDIQEQSRFKNINNVRIPPLDFVDLPEYETTDEEEEGDEENSYAEPNNPFEKTENEMNQDRVQEQQLMSPAPHDRLHQFIDGSTGPKEGTHDGPIRITNNDLGIEPVPKFDPGSQAQTSSKKSMTKKDYQKSMKYIENFYQQNSQHVMDSDSARQQKTRQDDSGMLFDDAPKSVTEESSMIGDEKHMAGSAVNKMLPPGTSSIPNKLYKPDGNHAQGISSGAKKEHGASQKMTQLMDSSIQQNFDQSEKFDESAGQIQPDTVGGRLHRVGHGLGGPASHQEALEIMGVTIDSQSFDQSIIDQSMTSELKRKRRNKKQKEDLDGSRLFREHGDDDVNEQSMISQKSQKGGAHQKMGKIGHMMQGQHSAESMKGLGGNKRH